MVQRVIILSVAVAVIVLATAQSAAAATVALQSKDIEVGLATPVSLSLSLANAPGDTVAGAQVDLIFDPNLIRFTNIAMGAAAAAAAKTATASELEPGIVRIMIAGFNLNNISDGILAQVSFFLHAGMPSGDYTIELDNLVLSNAYGVAVGASAVPAVISITALPLPLTWAPWAAGLLALLIGGLYKCRLTTS